MGVERVLDSADRLGECPLWDERERVLWWVDILAPAIKCFDGKCIDADGCLWNAEWGGGRVVRYTPAGKVDRVIEAPAANPTCCCFGGARLDTLYITSADGSGVFAVRPGFNGLPEARFAG
jgi:sugar lactone lactonase YvrE